ncbi:MAG: hypothetical protein GX352_02310 [Clostridiales bacterium]|nr:hypothetical protein [Clostridiales bacterium]
MSDKKRPINGLLILTVMAAALLYGSFLKDNRDINKQLQIFGHTESDLESGEALQAGAFAQTGSLNPQILDGFSEEPIQGAVVVVPETGGKYITDENGYTPQIKAPIIPNPNFRDIHPQVWGEITLIVYKEGYIEYILLHTNIWEGQNRQGPKILLFKKEDKLLDQPMSIIEGPNQLWINSLVEQYKP